MKSIILLFAVFCFFNLSSQNEFTLVNAISGEPIPFVSIYNKTKKKSLKTNENGKILLSAIAMNDSFEIRYLGYKKLIFLLIL